MKLAVGGVADVSSGDEFRRIINCNMMSAARMTNLILPGMRKRRRGLIINIGSIAGTGFAIHRATYGATKVSQFSLLTVSYTFYNNYVLSLRDPPVSLI